MDINSQQSDGLYHPSTGGTMIKDILDQNKRGQNMPAVQLVQSPNYHLMQHSQNQHDPNPQQKQQRQAEQESVQEIARHRRTKELQLVKNAQISESTDETEEHFEQDAQYEPASRTSLPDMGAMLIEPILLVTLYVILSQPQVIAFISGYINQLNPTGNSDVPMSGIIIYGVILTCSFLILRKLIYAKMSY